MTEEKRHRLSGRNYVDMTAVCEIDGPVKMRSRGKGRLVCGVKVAERHARWAANNPQKATRNRAIRSAHKLVSFDPSTHTGVCPVCGTVGVVPKGRGWMCEVRAKQLWSNQQSAPQERCAVCRRVWLDAAGVCAYCTDHDAHAIGAAMNADRDLADLKQWAADWCEEVKPLETVVDERTHDPYSVDGDTVANPTLKTIGAGVPRGRKPEAFINTWWAENAHLVEREA